MTAAKEEIVLASGSPRRRDLLHDAGYRFRVIPSAVAEPPPLGFASPEAYVTHLAWLKANDVAKSELGIVVGADTACCVGDEILGKPEDRADAARILRTLQGTCHRTLTGICVIAPQVSEFNSKVSGWFRPTLVDCVQTVVWMRQLTNAQLQAYLDTGAWKGKAGAYGIQNQHDPFVERIDGSYSNVVGLPMERLAVVLDWAISQSSRFAR